MTALTSPKGPLPPRVYWTRRGVLLGVVLLLVFGIARVLGGGSDATSDAPQARRAAATQSSAAPTSAAATDPAAPTTGAPATTDPSAGTPGTPAATPATTPATTPAPGKGRKGRGREPVAPVLPTPTSVCANEDVVVTPSADGAEAGARVQLVLTLRTRATPACTWQVSPDSVTLKITSGSDDIWSSQECPRAVPTQDVTLYRDTDTAVPVVWSGRRSDEECSRLTEAAMPGWYHVAAAAYAGEPTSVQFELGVPAPVTITKTVEPEPEGGSGRRAGRGSAEPSGAVEPDGD